MYRRLRGLLPAKLVALLNMMDYRSDDTVRRVAGVQMLTPVNSGHLSDQHGLVTVQMREDVRGLTIGDIGTILGLAHLMRVEDRRWLTNSRIDLRTFNEVYWRIWMRESGLGYAGESCMILILYIEDIEATLNPHHEFARPGRGDT